MSCQSSAQSLPHASDPIALAGALITVAERSFFSYAELATHESVGATTGNWYQASVQFRGPFSGCVRLALPVGLARDLCVSFLGLEPDAVVADPAVCDLAGELTNMVCGSWLTGLGEAECFELTHPEVQIIDAAPAAGVVVTVDYQPAIIILEIAPGEK